MLGQNHEYAPHGPRLLGCLTSFADYNAAFWNYEKLEFSLAQAPKWLTTDPATGLLSGTPTEADVGRHEVVLRVRNDKGGEAEERAEVEVQAAAGPPD